jgi:hypothetical protein
MVLFSILSSLLKLVITVCLNSRLCEYPTYILTLLISVTKYTHTMFRICGFFYVNYGGRLENFVPCLGKTLSCWLA